MYCGGEWWYCLWSLLSGSGDAERLREVAKLLLMDSTYKLVDMKTPVFTIITVDSLVRGVPLVIFRHRSLKTAETNSLLLYINRQAQTSSVSLGGSSVMDEKVLTCRGVS